VLDPAGASVGEAPEIPRDDLRRLFRHMLKMRVLDQRMLSLQRQGRIGFYGTATGQEASVTGGACAWRDTDWVFPALREMGVALWRGTTIQEIVCQLIGNSGDVLIGRQMPCHFSDRRVRTVAWSSVIGTQLPHAMGAAWASKLLGDGAICIGYLGDGATSAGDFHAAANFAGVFKLPLVFFCQNNQWAISVPLSRQTASASIAIKASAYGFPGVRVDGNDILAVIAAARAAAERARRDPLARFRTWLGAAGMLDAADEERWTRELNDEISAAITAAEALPPPPIESMFTDVYKDMPRALEEQMRYAVAMGEGQKFEGTFPL